MKKCFNHKSITITFATILVLLPLYSQEIDPDDPSGVIEAHLTALVKSQFGQEYECSFSVLDSAIKRNESTYDGGELTDPYNTLKGCILFGADKNNIFDADVNPDPEHGLIGIYKNGQIVWHSDSIFKGVMGGIFSIKDINVDGKVDILVEWTPGGMQDIMTRHLWIISWDGLTGTIINQVSPENGNTTIHAQESMFNLIETDTTSPMLIRGNWPGRESYSEWFPNTKISTLPYITYSWNGSQYGLWSSTPQIPGEQYLPANRLSVSVQCAVNKFQDSLSFQYHWSNSATSRQRMQKFSLVGVKKSFYPIQPSGWMFLGWWIDLPLASWKVFGKSEYNLSILPGENKNGVIVHAQALPTIVKFYAQGYRPSPDFGADRSSKKLRMQNDLLNNSFIGTTIGPVDPPDPFISLNNLDTLISYTTQSRTLGWITTQPIANKYLNYFNTAKTQLQSNNNSGAKTTLQQVLTDVNIDSSSTPATQTAGKLTSEAYALLRFNTEYVISKLPAQTTPYLNIALKNSTGAKLSGGTLQYYDASPNGAGWKDAVNNNDGTFSINTTKTSLSLRMTYAYGSQQKNNVPINSDTVIFQTVNAQVQLRNSNETLLDTGTVQYYAGLWRTFGTTTDGIATKELLAGSYSFRMTYGYASIDTVQDLNTNPTVVFKTTNAQVQLKNSQGNFIDQGTVQYYAGAWRTFGTISNGIATKELLPTNYSFRMTYAYGSSDKAQNIGSNNTVLFSTVLATVSVKNMQNNPVNNAIVTYYSGAWRTFGTTVNGQAVKELLPINLQFRAKLGTAQADKTQNLLTNPLVEIQLNVAQ